MTTTPAIALKPAAPFASRVTHAYDALTGIVHIALDQDEAGYYCDRAEDGIVLTKITSREEHRLTFDGHGMACSCKGYQYRHICRHSVAVAQLIESNDL